MRHPKRSITRDIRTRRPLHPGRERDELEALTWPASVVVRDRMNRSVVSIHADALAKGASEMMRTRRIRHLPVVDHGGRLVGIVTDRDLRQVIFDPAIQQRIGSLSEALKTVTVADIMTRGVITVRPGTGIRDAARLMREQRIGALPVVEGDKVVGILTEADVLKTFQEVIDEASLAKPYRWALAYR
jgi:acetoin utilization protein AcuB